MTFPVITPTQGAAEESLSDLKFYENPMRRGDLLWHHRFAISYHQWHPVIAPRRETPKNVCKIASLSYTSDDIQCEWNALSTSMWCLNSCALLSTSKGVPKTIYKSALPRMVRKTNQSPNSQNPVIISSNRHLVLLDWIGFVLVFVT